VIFDITGVSPTPIQLDTDQDGLPDWWEEQYFGGVTNANPVALCSNGVNTVKEAFIAGLDPNNPNDNFLVSISADTIRWTSISGRVYSVFWTSDLMQAFQPLETSIPWKQSSYSIGDFTDSSFFKIGVKLDGWQANP